MDSMDDEKLRNSRKEKKKRGWLKHGFFNMQEMENTVIHKHSSQKRKEK
jgi:hypothetical protein